MGDNADTFGRQYAKLVAQMEHFAAWQPTVTPFQVGDYGYLNEHCLFKRISNIDRDFGIKVETTSRPSGTPLNISLSRWQCRDVEVDGKANVLGWLLGVSGTMTIEFEGKECWMMRTRGNLSVETLENTTEVTGAIFELPERDWNLEQFFIVNEVYTAENPVIIGSTSEDFQLTLSGSVKALNSVKEGSGSAGVKGSGGSGSHFQQLSNDSGPVALGLFQVKKVMQPVNHGDRSFPRPVYPIPGDQINKKSSGKTTCISCRCSNQAIVCTLSVLTLAVYWKLGPKIAFYMAAGGACTLVVVLLVAHYSRRESRAEERLLLAHSSRRESRTVAEMESSPWKEVDYAAMEAIEEACMVEAYRHPLVEIDEEEGFAAPSFGAGLEIAPEISVDAPHKHEEIRQEHIPARVQEDASLQMAPACKPVGVPQVVKPSDFPTFAFDERVG